MIDSAEIKQFFPSFQPYITKLLLGDVGKKTDTKGLGISPGSIQILDIHSSIRPSPREKSNNPLPSADRFKVLLPYATHFVKWDVTFNAKAPHMRPDFAFSDDFLADPDEEVIEREVPSFFKWDYRNDNALLQVLKELLALYNKYQIDLLVDYNRPYGEYNTFTAADCLNEDDVQVLIGNGDNLKKTRPTAAMGVHFLMALNVDFTRLPPGFENINCSLDRVLLHITFMGTFGNRITTELQWSPTLEVVLGKTYSVFLPPFHAYSCLMDYVPQVTKMLQDKITAIVTTFEKRKEYIAALLDKLPGIIEYDSITFFTAAFLVERQDFHCLLRISLSEKFPNDKPSFIFQSVYHVINGRPYEKKGSDFPYNPRWLPEDMVSRALTYSFTFVEQFQKESVEALHIQNQRENKL